MHTDSQFSVDVEALCTRIANLKYIWTSPEMGESRPVVKRDEKPFIPFKKKFSDGPRHKRTNPANQVDSFMVSITPAEDVASTIPLGFRDVLPDASNKSRRKEHGKPMVCNFCKNNREVRDIYLTHYLYDPVTKVLSCPVLRKHICEICGETGDNAHTLQYCRLNKARGAVKGNVPKMLCTLSVTNSAGKIRRN